MANGSSSVIALWIPPETGTMIRLRRRALRGWGGLRRLAEIQVGVGIGEWLIQDHLDSRASWQRGIGSACQQHSEQSGCRAARPPLGPPQARPPPPPSHPPPPLRRAGPLPKLNISFVCWAHSTETGA